MARGWRGAVLASGQARCLLCDCTEHRTRNPLPYWELVCHSSNQLRPITQKVSKVLWAKVAPGRVREGRLASHPLTPPCWNPVPCTGLFPSQSLHAQGLPVPLHDATETSLASGSISLPAVKGVLLCPLVCPSNLSPAVKLPQLPQNGEEVEVLHTSTPEILPQLCEILQAKEAGFRDGKQLVQGHTAEKDRGVVQFSC